MRCISIARRIVYFFAVAIAVTLIVLVSLMCGGCAKVDSRPPIVFTPVNPDVASVSSIVAQSKASTVKASDSAARAVKIVESIVVAPGQEIELERLKLELSTTIEQLKFAGEFLENANKQVKILSGQVADMKQWGVEQNRLYVAEYKTAQTERSRADAEHKAAFRNGRERDVFVLLFSIAGTVSLVNFFRSFLWKLQPGIAALALASIALGSFVACFTLVRLIVSAVVRLTT